MTCCSCSLVATIGKSQLLPHVGFLKGPSVGPDHVGKEERYTSAQENKAGQSQSQADSQVPATKADMLHIIGPIP